MLTLLILIPILGSLLLIPINEELSENKTKMKNIAITTSLINFIISIFLWLNFDSSSTHYQFVYEFNKLSFLDFNIGIDGISLYFVLLTTFISPVALLSNYTNIDKNLKYFLISFLLLETLQIFTFVALDLLLFYVFFESVLPILFIIIIIYGSGKDKTRSALLLFLYTLFGSLPMLLSILSIQSIVGSTDYLLLSLVDINLDSQKLLWLGFFIAFAIKTPLWPLSIWLPKAHADSPLAGSIILAGTILKLASYGMLRILLTYLPDASNYFSPVVQMIAITSLIYASLSTILQQDTKKLIAYSSITHMAIVVLGIFSNNIIGIEGAILLSIAHGFVSPALFICVGGIIYDRTGTRLIKQLKGLVLYMPIFTILFFVFSLANMATPLTLNFLGEQMSLIGIWSINPIISIVGGTGIVLSACYTIFFYNRISYGAYSPHLKPLKDISRIEFISLITLLIPTLLFGIYPNLILDTLHASVTQLLYTINLTPIQESFFVAFNSELTNLFTSVFSMPIIITKIINNQALNESLSNTLSIFKTIPITKSTSKNNTNYKIYKNNKKNQNNKKIKQNDNPERTCKDIVVWGSNLGLTIGLPVFNTIIRNMVKLPYYQLSVIIGILLSDAKLQLSYSNFSLSNKLLDSLNLNLKRNASLTFSQSFTKFHYFMFIFNILSHYCSSFPILQFKKILKTRSKTYTAIRFSTRALPCLTELYKLFYKISSINSIGDINLNIMKVIPNDIFNLLTPIALAHWIMGAGSRRGSGLLLCTDKFSIQEVVLLINVLIIRYNLKCTININKNKPGQYRIYISTKSMNNLVSIVKPHMMPSMLYKLNIHN